MPLQPPTATPDRTTYSAFGASQLASIPQLERVPDDLEREMRVVSSVLPFRVNRHVLEELIDWDDVPRDPMFQLTFPQREMLEPEDYDRVEGLLDRGDEEGLERTVAEIRTRLNPHPGNQQHLNVPRLDGVPVEGVQHKYPQTMLVFPSQGQTCHAYCSFCFRWAQFVQDKELRFATSGYAPTLAYLRQHEEISDVLVTGGDPMVMKTRLLERYLLPLLEPEYAHVQTIRIGTKSLTFWPGRYVTDPDADELLALLERLARAGKHVAVMVHHNHPRELAPRVARQAIRRLRDAGVTLRSQGPLLAHVNDNARDWAELWRTQVRLGIVPYYQFVERDTGARRYFEVPLARALEIYQGAVRELSGLGRTARGPVMSTGPGKVKVDGVLEVDGRKAFVLTFVQARRRAWNGRTFLARFDPEATWLSKLRPLDGERFFFEDEYERMLSAGGAA